MHHIISNSPHVSIASVKAVASNEAIASNMAIASNEASGPIPHRDALFDS